MCENSLCTYIDVYYVYVILYNRKPCISTICTKYKQYECTTSTVYWAQARWARLTYILTVGLVGNGSPWWSWVVLVC